MRHAAPIVLVLAACTGMVETNDTVGGDIHGIGGHPDPVDPWQVVERIRREGPPRYTSRFHSCPKMRYRTIGTVLASRGVDLARTDELAAAQIYRTAAAALGGPNYGARVRENIELGLATTAKLFDIYVQAAPEILATMASRPACAGASPFDAAGRCERRGITCLIGVPATQAHLDLCNQTVQRAADPASGQALAVAVLAAAAHTCE